MYRRDKKEDFYTKLSKKEGYPARSVYKLQEIDEKYKIIKKGDKVLDLGSAPGSWLIYVSKKIGDKGKVIGVDLKDIENINRKNISFIKKNIFELNSSDFKGKFQVVLSDLAPKTCGLKFIDSGKSLELSEKALEIVRLCLILKGNFVCKIFEGESSQDFFEKIKKYFDFVKRFRTKASNKESKEFYIIARGFKY
ncbi:MAG: RlmE family RNA methyltransferase [Candidatus Pacebacteria bacterium]|nr:RlmE family RNA methyltransferase [Candidatus Paceibacterota bacterium]